MDDTIVNEILKVALTAPAGFGGHPVEFVVIRDKEMIRKIARCKRMGAGPLSSANVAIVVMADARGDELWIEDSAIASSYILLAAEQYGIGASWIHMRNRAGQRTTADEEIRQLLGIPANFSVLNAVALGQKNENKPAYTEKDLLKQNVHYENFANI
ncbi:nitroreductase family protein [Clostridium sp. 19966]|nr:nitroreductase family protein [Clostridium sp. 19966]